MDVTSLVDRPRIPLVAGYLDVFVLRAPLSGVTCLTNSARDGDFGFRNRKAMTFSCFERESPFTVPHQLAADGEVEESMHQSLMDFADESGHGFIELWRSGKASVCAVHQCSPISVFVNGRSRKHFSPPL